MDVAVVDVKGAEVYLGTLSFAALVVQLDEEYLRKPEVAASDEVDGVPEDDAVLAGPRAGGEVERAIGVEASAPLFHVGFKAELSPKPVE